MTTFYFTSNSVHAIYKISFYGSQYIITEKRQKTTISKHKKTHITLRISATCLMISIVFNCTTQTQAAKPVLGKYYREPEKSGPFPLHLIKYFQRSISQDHFVSETGDIVFYQTDPLLLKNSCLNNNKTH